jgi:hypothetical protein
LLWAVALVEKCGEPQFAVTPGRLPPCILKFLLAFWLEAVFGLRRLVLHLIGILL